MTDLKTLIEKNIANSMKDHLLKLVEALELLTTDKMGSEVSRSIANVVLHDLKQELGDGRD